MRERNTMSPLSDEQRALLLRLPESGDGELVTGATIQTADKLVRRHYARCISRERNSQAGRYLRTPTGTREASTDHEAPRVRRLLERLRKATARSFDEDQLVRLVFGTGFRSALGLEVAIARLRAREFTSTMSAARAVHLLTDQEVAP
jgi:hypothetical protein